MTTHDLSFSRVQLLITPQQATPAGKPATFIPFKFLLWYTKEMELPESLKPFQKEAELYLAKGLVREIEFSAATYQVLVKELETGRPIWTFLQLDKDGSLKDFFCDDEEGEELAPCVHLCAAYLRLYNQHDSPLGERFENSLWNHLGRLFADRLGDKPSLLRKEGRGIYTHHSGGGKLLFEVKAKTPKSISLLKDLLEKRPSDTEETSLKIF